MTNDCGCRAETINPISGSYSIIYCPLHERAGDYALMLKAMGRLDVKYGCTMYEGVLDGKLIPTISIANRSYELQEDHIGPILTDELRSRLREIVK